MSAEKSALEDARRAASNAADYLDKASRARKPETLRQNVAHAAAALERAARLIVKITETWAPPQPPIGRPTRSLAESHYDREGNAK